LRTTITAPVSGTVLTPTSSIIPVVGDQVTAGQVVYRLSPISAMIAETTDQPVVNNIEIPADTVLLKTFVSPGQFVEAGQPLFEIADISKVWVRVQMTEAEFNRVDRGLNANILFLESDDADDGMEAEIIDEDDVNEIEDEDEAGDEDFVIYYGLDNSDHKLSLGQHIQARLALAGNGKSHNVIPYAAVIYDTEGNTWVYTNPEPLVFVRQPIVIDYIEGDQAVLAEGIASGTQVVTIGSSELLGAELGVAK
jgi:multidrug efflux pump subunit AcrA (membrane-fusion protein)